jgi:hypothetical protein
VDLEALIENVLNAVTAGITIGCIYGLMCVGLGLIYGIMRIVNFAQGELLMLGMFTSLYLVTGGGVLAFLGPLIGPFVPDGRLKYDENGRRVGAKLCLVQWRDGKPVPVYPAEIATHEVLWPKV